MGEVTAASVMRILRTLSAADKKRVREQWENLAWSKACDEAEAACKQLSTLCRYLGVAVLWESLDAYLMGDDSHLIVREEEGGKEVEAVSVRNPDEASTQQPSPTQGDGVPPSSH